MYLMSDAAVEKLKELDDAEKMFSVLDRQMKKVLYSKKLPPQTKWILYTNLLTKYDNLRRSMSQTYYAQKNNQKKISSETQTPTEQPNPFDRPNRTHIPDLDGLDYSNDFESRDNSHFFNVLENNILGEGEQEPLSPNSSRRLSAFSVASATKKSLVPMRHHLVPEPSWIGDETTPLTNAEKTIIEEEEPIEIIESPEKPKKKTKSKDSVSITIGDWVYTIHKDDLLDFKDFAYEEQLRYPHQDRLIDSRFQEWKKRNNREYRERMEAEEKMIAAEKEREKIRKKEEAAAAVAEKSRKDQEINQRNEEYLLHWTGADKIPSTSRKSISPEPEPKTPVKKTKTATVKAKKQVSVARISPKIKSARETRILARQALQNKTRENLQDGKGMPLQWVSMK